MFQRQKKETSDGIRSAQVDRDSAQGAIPFLEWYSNGIFRLQENTYAVICSFSNAGYLSKTGTEQTRKYNAYREVLASLPPYLHYEEIISNRPVNRQTYLDAVASGARTDDVYENAFFDVQKKLVGTVDREISLKRYLLALSVEVSGTELPYNKLFDAVDMLDGRFREMGSGLTLLSPDEVFAELFRWYNPFEGEMPELPHDLYRRGLTIKDFIAADSIRFAGNYIELGGAFCRVFSITSYGSEIVDHITYTLLNNDLPISVSKHVEHVEKEEAIRNVKRQLGELEGRRQERLAKNKKDGLTYMPLDLVRAIEGCNQLLDALAGNEEFIRQTVYVTVRARNADQLEEYSDRIKSAALSAHCTLRPVRFFQEDALKSVLPLGKDHLMRHQFMLSSEAAVMTPFSYESYFDPNGFWYGRNGHSGEPVIVNRKLGKSSHGFVFGVSGSGKGMWVKNEISNILYQPFTANDEVIVVDASGEYIPMARAVNGKVIELESASSTHLNPLYISPAQEMILGRQQAIASKIEHMIALLSQIKAGDGLNAVEKNLVDTVAGRCLKKPGATLNMFYDELEKEARKQPQLKKHTDELRSWLQRYVEGSVTLFAGEDTGAQDGDRSARMTVYSVRNLSGDLRNAGMLAMLERIEARVIENYEAGRRTWIYIDEMHRYFDAERNPYAAARFARLYSELRKYGAILTGITQLPKPVIQSKDGSTMLSLSRFVVMAELDGTNIDAVKEQYALNEDQQRTLASPDIGQYVVRMNNAPTSVRMVYPGAKEADKNLMYDLFNTSFDDTGKEQIAV